MFNVHAVIKWISPPGRSHWLQIQGWSCVRQDSSLLWRQRDAVYVHIAEYEKRQPALIVEPRRGLRRFATRVESEFTSSRAVGRAGSTLCGMNHVFAVVLAGKELRCACLIAALVGDCVAPRRRENPKICLWLPAAFKICFAALIRILFFSPLRVNLFSCSLIHCTRRQMYVFRRRSLSFWYLDRHDGKVKQPTVSRQAS